MFISYYPEHKYAMKEYRLIKPSGIYTCAFVNAKLIFSLQAGVMDYVTVSLYTGLCVICLQLF